MPTQLFDRIATQYDTWYDTPEGSALFAAEVATLRPLIEAAASPALEVGVGTGRFAAELGLDYGIDPALGALEIARSRNVSCIAASGEALPFVDGTIGCVVFAFTLCFVEDPLQALWETRRVLAPGGTLVLGVIPSEGPLGQHYQALARGGHRIYRQAHFFTRSEHTELLNAAGFQPGRSRSVTMRMLDSTIVAGDAQEGDHDEAGFLALTGTKSSATRVSEATFDPYE